MDDLHRRLRAAAEAHQPDRDAILARLQQGMADSSGSARSRAFRRRRRASWIKISLAGIAGVGVLGVGGLAVAVGVQQRTTPPRPSPPPAVTPTGNAVAATPKPRPSATRSAAPTSPATSPPTSPATSSPTTSRHTSEPAADGPIAARGTISPKSIIYWAQNDLTIDVAQPLTALTVEIRIAQTDGVQNTGNWRTEPADEFTVSVAPADGFLVYRWTLKPGRTVPAAQEVFAAQYNHTAGKRDASKDTFRVETTVAGHTSVVRGNFPAGN